MGLLHTDLLLHECNEGPSPTGGIIYSEPDKGGGAGMKQNIQVIKQGGRMAVKVRQGTGREEEGKATDKERK